jgi:16S rRNA (guanine(966)-N(2))-methyltransferase RsmD
MRILAGKYKSKKIQTINNSNTRPMMSKVREAIFNSLQFLIEDKVVLDLYAGSGSLGIEAISRGAKFVTFVEKSKECIDVLNKNLKELEINFIITNTAVETFIKSSINTYDIVFYDPPFEMGSDKVENEINNLVEIIRVGSFVVVHRHKASSEIEFSKNYEIHRDKNYGQSKIIILRKL